MVGKGYQINEKPIIHYPPVYSGLLSIAGTLHHDILKSGGTSSEKSEEAIVLVTIKPIFEATSRIVPMASARNAVHNKQSRQLKRP